MSPARRPAVTQDDDEEDDDPQLEEERRADEAVAEQSRDEWKPGDPDPDAEEDDADPSDPGRHTTPEAGAGRRLYLDSHSGHIEGFDRAPDARQWYRLVGTEDEAGQALTEGEYPLVVSDAVLRMPRQQRQDKLEQLRQQQYEDPGWIFEQHPEHAPDAWLQQREQRAGDARADQGPGEPVAPTGRSLQTSEAGGEDSGVVATIPPRRSLAGAGMGGPGSAVGAAQQPAATPANLVQLDPAVAERLHRLLAQRRGQRGAPQPQPTAAAAAAPTPGVGRSLAAFTSPTEMPVA